MCVCVCNKSMAIKISFIITTSINVKIINYSEKLVLFCIYFQKLGCDMKSLSGRYDHDGINIDDCETHKNSPEFKKKNYAVWI